LLSYSSVAYLLLLIFFSSFLAGINIDINGIASLKGSGSKKLEGFLNKKLLIVKLISTSRRSTVIIYWYNKNKSINI